MMRAFIPARRGLSELPKGEPIAGALWIDLYRPQPEQSAAVAALGLEVPSLADMEEIEISNRLYRDEGADYLTVVLQGKTPEGDVVAGPVTFIIGAKRLVTVRHHSPRPFETFPDRADRSSSGHVTPDRMFLGLIEEIIARQADLLEGVGLMLDATAAQVFSGQHRGSDADLQARLEGVGQQSEINSRVRLAILSIGRALSFYGATMSELDEGDALRAIVKMHMRDLQSLEVHADFLSGRVGLVVDATMGMINLKQNVTMRILSVITALFLPPTLITSFYGMNFHNMPELDKPWGYPMAIGAMIGSAALTWLILKWKDWL